ncbi:MAG: hypothetical protein ABI613_08445 [Gemmatimonadota bacterium]
MPLLTDYAELPLDRRKLIEHEVAPHETLEQVLLWAKRQAPPLTITEILTQDEYTHDVVIPFRDGLYLVYDTT